MNQIAVQKKQKIIPLKIQSFLTIKPVLQEDSNGNNVETDGVETVVPLKYLSNFWEKINVPLINCDISLTLAWSENCVLTSKATRKADTDADPAVAGINNPTNAVTSTGLEPTTT